MSKHDTDTKIYAARLFVLIVDLLAFGIIVGARELNLWLPCLLNILIRFEFGDSIAVLAAVH